MSIYTCVYELDSRLKTVRSFFLNVWKEVTHIYIYIYVYIYTQCVYELDSRLKTVSSLSKRERDPDCTIFLTIGSGSSGMNMYIYINKVLTCLFDPLYGCMAPQVDKLDPEPRTIWEAVVACRYIQHPNIPLAKASTFNKLSNVQTFKHSNIQTSRCSNIQTLKRPIFRYRGV